MGVGDSLLEVAFMGEGIPGDKGSPIFWPSPDSPEGCREGAGMWVRTAFEQLCSMVESVLLVQSFKIGFHLHYQSLVRHQNSIFLSLI